MKGIYNIPIGGSAAAVVSQEHRDSPLARVKLRVRIRKLFGHLPEGFAAEQLGRISTALFWQSPLAGADGIPDDRPPCGWHGCRASCPSLRPEPLQVGPWQWSVRRTAANGERWDEWIELGGMGCDEILPGSFLVFRYASYSGAIDLLDRSGQFLRQGLYKVPLLECPVCRGPTAKTLNMNMARPQMARPHDNHSPSPSQMMERYDQILKEVEGPLWKRVSWLDDLAFAQIAREQAELANANRMLFLIVELIKFDAAVRLQSQPNGHEGPSVERSIVQVDAALRPSQSIFHVPAVARPSARSLPLLRRLSRETAAWPLPSYAPGLLWRYREWLATHSVPCLLPLFIKSVDWVDPEELSLAQGILERWSLGDPPEGQVEGGRAGGLPLDQGHDGMERRPVLAQLLYLLLSLLALVLGNTELSVLDGDIAHLLQRLWIKVGCGEHDADPAGDSEGLYEIAIYSLCQFLRSADVQTRGRFRRVHGLVEGWLEGLLSGETGEQQGASEQQDAAANMKTVQSATRPHTTQSVTKPHTAQSATKPHTVQSAAKMYAAQSVFWILGRTDWLSEGLSERADLLAQQALVANIQSVIDRARRVRGGRLQKLAALCRALEQPEDQQPQLLLLRPPIPLPTEPRVRVAGVIPERSAVYKSAAMPVKIAFLGADDTAEHAVLVKTDEDLQGDLLVQRAIRLIAGVWQAAGLDLRTISYSVLPTSPGGGGWLQFVRSASLSAILADNGGSLVPYLESLLPESPGTARDNFVRSCAGYCLITFVLGIGDRHLENLLIDDSGRLFHVDYAYRFGADPKPFPPPMKLCREMVEAMMTGGGGGGGGGNASLLAAPEYLRFRSTLLQAYQVLRQQAHVLLDFLALHSRPLVLSVLQAGGGERPSEQLLVSRSDIAFVRDRLALDAASDADALRAMQQLVDESVTALFPQVLEAIHKWAQYWRS